METIGIIGYILGVYIYIVYWNDAQLGAWGMHWCFSYAPLDHLYD